jgi:hypothetical protein
MTGVLHLTRQMDEAPHCERTQQYAYCAEADNEPSRNAKAHN